MSSYEKLIAHKLAATERQAYTAKEFCITHSISLAHFYALLRRGEGPKCFFAGKRRLISVEAAKEWRETQTELACSEIGV